MGNTGAPLPIASMDGSPTIAREGACVSDGAAAISGGYDGVAGSALRAYVRAVWLPLLRVARTEAEAAGARVAVRCANARHTLRDWRHGLG